MSLQNNEKLTERTGAIIYSVVFTGNLKIRENIGGRVIYYYEAKSQSVPVKLDFGQHGAFFFDPPCIECEGELFLEDCRMKGSVAILLNL